ncbi:hypothetical protein SUGI_0434050 [Cryptomeria japonica]|uniref:lysine-specific demethylase JMJ705 n=1 Tax=Cryptomeria japonica TaxID=3369 RepID=UPI002408C023|nr:lysine-specific demethylase JMJ705 [Cryptomeria japonica]GLJ23005.1 hypothetical protein SUGI_0434050 [Cryptomeria japonica]
MGEREVLPWLKAMPVAPEFRPTEAEFADPIAYILKIEKEASQYGICKIIPPIPKSPKKSVIANLNLCLGQPSNNTNTTAATGLHPGPSVNSNVLVRENGVAKFTTRQQQIGWSLKRPRGGGGPVQTVVQKPVWQSGETYTLEQFEAKAKHFSRSRLKTTKDAAPLMVETLFWKATADKPITVEYANDIPGTAFGDPGKKFSPPSSPPSGRRKRKKYQQWKQKKEEGSHDACDITDTAWNMRIVSRSDGSLLRYMPVEVAGVTSPMIYIAMLFSWFAWHVEDHDLHSLNYLHMGAPKTWYAVPGEAASAFEEVVRREGYGGQVNPLVAFAMLGEKTTVMSPEVLIAASVPCCRVVQNAGEFVITFPRAYHLGFSHGFNCGEAANLATPEWLKVAKEAAVRRAATKFLPMLSHQQLLYLLALGSTSRIPMSVTSEPRSSRLKHRQRGEGEMIVKKGFLDDVIENNSRLSRLLQKTSAHHAVLWNSANVSCDFPYSPLCFSTLSEIKSSASLCMDGMDVSALPSETASNISTPACIKEEFCRGSSFTTAEKEPSSRIGTSLLNNVKQEDIASYYANPSSLHDNNNDQGSKALYGDMSSSETDIDTGPLACTVCGILGFASMAVIQPCQEAATVLLSTNYKTGQNYVVTDGSETALATQSKMYLMDNKNVFKRKMVQLNQHGAAPAYKDTHAYQHVSENMDLVDVKEVMQIESIGLTGKSSGIFLESFKQKESIDSSVPNDACMPKTSSSGNNSGIPQISALDLLAATYGDTMDSDEENDTNVTNTSDHACDTSNGAEFENSHDLCDAADVPKVDVFVSKGHNLQKHPQLSSCALAGSKEEIQINDVLISEGLKPDNICPFANEDMKDSFSNSMRTDTFIAGESSICSSDQCLTRNATFHSYVSEDQNDFQRELNVSGIQFPVVEGNNSLQKHNSLAPACMTGLDNILQISLKGTLDSSVHPSSRLEDPNEVSRSCKEPSGMVVSSTRDGKGDLTQIELSSKNSNLEMSESKQSTEDLEAGKSALDRCADCSETQYVYDCQPLNQVPVHYEPKEICANNDGSVSMSVGSNKTQACDVVVANTSHVADAGSLPDKTYDMPRETTNASSLWKPAKGFLRPRVFCLEHALEIQEQLQPMGDAHFLIVCHLSYPKMEQQARLLAAELGNDYSWKDIQFKKVAAEDLEVIHSAIDDDEDTEIGSNDWTVQLGVSLHYSVKLSKSPLFCKQMPYNPILEALFINSYLNNYSDDSAYGSSWNCDMNKQGKKSKHKKITVAGKWCGRVWMVNQVHPYLRDPEVQPSAFFAPKTIKIGASQEQGHLQKCMGQDADCKPIVKPKNIITSDNNMVEIQDGSHFQKETIQDPDSKLILKPRMTITSGKIIKSTPSEQPLMTYKKNKHNAKMSTRSGFKGKMSLERQIGNIMAQLSQNKTVSMDESTLLTNQPKGFQEDSIIKSESVAFSTHSELNKDAEGMRQREKVLENGNCVQANHTDYKEDTSGLEIEIQHTRGIFGENTMQNKTNRQLVVKDEVEVIPNQGSQVQCFENALISNSHTVSRSCSSRTGELEGGPCTRLRPRSSKPKEEVVNRVAEKALQQSASSKTIAKGKKKVAKPIPSKNGEDKNIYCCDTEGCTMKFSSKHDLHLHKRNICTYKGCGKHFFSHKYLVQHRRVHLDERPLSCPWEGCEMTFKWAWARTEHIRVHTGERPYVCTTAGCGQTFRFVSDFSRHKRKTGHLPKK